MYQVGGYLVWVQISGGHQGPLTALVRGYRGMCGVRGAGPGCKAVQRLSGGCSFREAVHSNDLCQGEPSGRFLHLSCIRASTLHHEATRGNTSWTLNGE